MIGGRGKSCQDTETLGNRGAFNGLGTKLRVS